MKTVLQIQASDSAFAAFWVMDPLLPGVILTTVATVEPCRVGSSMCSRSAGWGAFAAILDDGSVVTWGHAAFGADSSAVQSQLKNVQQIQASQRAFACILSDGSVVTWGHAGFGGEQRCAGSAEACAADSSLPEGFCCHSWRWICRDLGSG